MLYIEVTVARNTSFLDEYLEVLYNICDHAQDLTRFDFISLFLFDLY